MSELRVGTDMDLSERRVAALRCPACGRTLTVSGELLRCRHCSATVPVVDGVHHFPVSVERPTVSRFFDRLSSIYETPLWFPAMYRAIGGPFAPADDRATVARLLDADGDELLDVACGTGRFTRYVAGSVAFAWGIDASAGMLRQAREYAERDGVENVWFARMAAEDLRFGPDSFDSVACCWALHLLPDVPAALREIRRVLRPGGRLVGTTLTDDHLLTPPGSRTWVRRAAGMRMFERRALRAALREVGFGTVEFERYGAALFFRAE